MATEEVSNLRKGLNLEGLIQNLDRVEDIDYWRRINPTVSISEYPFRGLENSQTVSPEVFESQAAWLREEGYFQTDPMVPAAMLREMVECIDVVRKAGFPPLFALVYDAFHVAFRHFHPIIKNIIGETYYIIPNYWVYYIEPSDAGKGFEPHRDAEYPDTIDASGMPTVITLWVAVTDATPLNSCIYLVPSNRDPDYAGAVGGLRTKATRFALEDVRALPTKAGTLSCWDQYVYHWGSRSSKRAGPPRVSYAVYCQRGDMPPVDDALIDLQSPLDFKTRLGLIFRGIHRYSYLGLQRSDQSGPLLEVIDRYMAVLKRAGDWKQGRS